MQEQPTPLKQSKTARKTNAQAARTNLAEYRLYVGDERNVEQLRRLCVATSHLARCFRDEGVTVTGDTTIGELMALRSLWRGEEI